MRLRVPAHPIGAEFTRVFEEEARKVGDEVSLLAQDTIYPDILESKDGVKAHHNVGGLPDDLQFELCEPVKLLFKDEVPISGLPLANPAWENRSWAVSTLLSSARCSTS